MVKRLTSAGGKARGVVKAPKVIKVGCDFSGMRIMGTAMARMFPSSKYVIKFASDTLDEAHMLAAHKSGNKPEIFYADVLERDLATVPETDVYAWTPPCQSYSTNAAGDGVKDPRGSLIAEGVKYVVKHKPRVAFFENVKGLMGTKHKPVVKGLHNALKRAGYRVHWKILCAKHLAVPQDRHRLIMVALLNPLASRPFAWPTPSTTQVSLNDILDPLAATDKPLRMPPRATSKKLVDIACKAAVAAGVNPKTVPVAVDIDCSLRYGTYGINIARTLTRRRGGSGGPWITSRGRRTSVNELVKIQGFDPLEVPWEAAGISKAQIGQLLGNAVPVPMIGRVLAEAMYSAGVVVTKPVWPERGRSSH
jgi:site-specific DNA-cytosine methylase